MEHFIETVDGLASRLDWDEDQRQEGMLAAFETVQKTEDFSDYNKVYRAVYSAAKYAADHSVVVAERRTKAELQIQECAEEISAELRDLQVARSYIGLLLSLTEGSKNPRVRRDITPVFLLTAAEVLTTTEVAHLTGYHRNSVSDKEKACLRRLRYLIRAYGVGYPWQCDRPDIFMHCEGKFREFVADMEPSIWKMREGK